MHNESKLRRFLLRSPVPLIIFIIIPVALVLKTVFHLPVPFRITQRLLLYNNIGLLLALGARFSYYLAGLRRGVRYGESARPAKQPLTPALPAVEVRGQLAGAGFHWNADGSYGEKHEPGYLGTILIYGGLFLLLGIGTYENLAQFSGTLLHGVGLPADLSKRGTFNPLFKGILSSQSGLPRLEVTKQVFPNQTYPKGASDIVLLSKDNTPVGSATIVGGGAEPYEYKGYDIYLAKQLVDIALNVRDRKDPDRTVFYDSVKFSPLWKKEGDYSMYATFAMPGGVDGEAYYNPDKKAFRFVLTRGGKPYLDTDYILHQYRSKEVGPYRMSIDAMGNWSEIHVVRRRHMELLWVGGIIAVIGLLVRIAFRPQRVWLEDAPDGCRVWAVGGEAKGRLKAEERQAEG
jgi:hypothetical protein